MILKSSRLSDRKLGQSTLEYLLQQRSKVRIIHYACESFLNSYNRAPRITSISIYDFDSKQIESFSIHLSSQELGYTSMDLKESELDAIERDLLRKFFKYVRANRSCKWVHWKMKDLSFGFKVLELRFKVLKGRPVTIQNDVKYDLSEILKQKYSSNYETNGDIGKLLALAKRNGFRLNKALPGTREAEAFNNKEYQLLHHSTQQKVEGLAFILEAAANNKLDVAARFYHVYGKDLPGIIKLIQEHPVYSLLSIIATLYPLFPSIQDSEGKPLSITSIWEILKEIFLAAYSTFNSI